MDLGVLRPPLYEVAGNQPQGWLCLCFLAVLGGGFWVFWYDFRDDTVVGGSEFRRENQLGCTKSCK